MSTRARHVALLTIDVADFGRHSPDVKIDVAGIDRDFRTPRA